MSFPQLAPMRLSRLRDALAGLIWGPARELAVSGGPVQAQPTGVAQAQRQRFVPVRRGERFGPPVGAHGSPRDGDYRQRWFQLGIPAPSNAERGRRHLHWLCGGESTVWLDGEPAYGLDLAHSTWLLPDRACTLWLDCGCYMTGMNGLWGPAASHLSPDIPRHDADGLRFDAALIRLRDQQAWDAFWDVDTLWQLLQHQLQRVGLGGGETADREITRLPAFVRQALRQAHLACDRFDGGGLAALGGLVREGLRSLRAEPWQIQASLVGYSHVDLLHIWPEHEAQRKGLHTAATSLALMEHYPELTFLQTQPALYHALDRLSPRLGRRIRARIGEGRWEASGGMLCEADTQLPCGEGLVRNLQLGQADFRRLTGRPSRVLWLIDVFGQSACMPQLMRLSGLELMHTVKQHWGRLTRFPHRSWRWRGPDGSEVLGHAPGTGNYCQQVDLAETATLAEDHQQADVHPDLLLATGYGDGGGGVTLAMLERARRMADLAGAPRARWDRCEAFLGRMRRCRADLPVWEGEIYLERHQGVSTGENHLKTAYRAAERAMQAYEAACAVAGTDAGGAEADWRRVCLAQFHDCLTGTSIRQVFDAITPEMAGIAARRLGEARRLLGAARRRDAAAAVFNPLVHERAILVVVPPEFAAQVPPEARQTGADGRVLAILDAAPLGLAPLAQARVPADHWQVSTNRLANDRVTAEFDAGGRLRHLAVDGEDLGLRAPASFILHPNHPMEHDAWDVDPWHLELGQQAALAGPLQVTESGPLRSTLAAELVCGSSRGRLAFSLQAGSPWLHCELDIEWQERQRLLKYHLPTRHLGRHAWYGTPFGAVSRAQRPRHLHEHAQWENCASRWAAVGDDTGEHGLAVVTADRYGFSCRDGELGATLLRGAIDPDPDADRGRHRIRWCLGRHRSRLTAGDPSTAAAAETLFAEAVLVPAAASRRPPCSWQDLGSLVPSWVLPRRGGGLVLRAHECAGEAGTALLTLAQPVRRVVCTDLLDRTLAPARRLDPTRWAIDYQPWQVLTVQTGSPLGRQT